MVTEGSIHYQSGGGIVADSDPENEYNETLLKAKALFSSLDIDHDPGTVAKNISTEV